MGRATPVNPAEKTQDKSGFGLLVASVRYENQQRAKHVENFRVACLDEGSTPSNSTRETNDLQRQNVVKAGSPITGRADFPESPHGR